MSSEPLSLRGARWRTLDPDPGAVSRVRQAAGLSEIAARCAVLRFGETDPLHPKRWLAPGLGQLHDPFQMRNMTDAVLRLRQAVERRERVRIITDYDVDGTTSSLILQAALKALAPDMAIDWHIPNRFDEGYGFSPAAARKAAEDGVGLIVTADIGVRDHAAVLAAREGQVDVLVCDHHLPPDTDVPQDALVLCPPQRGCGYPNRSLAACGVSLKLSTALLDGHPRWSAIQRSLLKLTAIGTVADLVPLTTPENRALVQLGLQALQEGPHSAGLEALLAVCGLERQITPSDLGFKVGPRINAAGRVADAGLVIDLLTCRDKGRAWELAQRLDQLNQERQKLQRTLETAALQALGDQALPPFVVVQGREDDGWHRGVLGIVASRLRERLNRPVAVIARMGELATGSIRSVPHVHAVRALDAVAPLLLRYGGHPAAAGFTLEARHVDALAEGLAAWAADGPTDAAALEEEVDGIVPAEALSLELMRELEQLGPFGMGNPKPRLVVPQVQPQRAALRGKTQALLTFDIPTRRGALPAIWWRAAEWAPALQGPVDLLGCLEENTWNGRRELRFLVQDARKAS